MLATAVQSRLRYFDASRRQRARDLAWQIYHQYEQELEAEKIALSELRRDARRYQEAVRIRRYIAGVRPAATEVVGGYEELSEGVIERLAWAEQKADWLDPLVPCSDILLDAPPKKKPSSW